MYIGMKCACFDTESTTVITVSYLEKRGSFIMKSTLSMSHCKSGIQRGYNLPTGACLISFVLMQRSQVLMYCPMYLDIYGYLSQKVTYLFCDELNIDSKSL